MGLTEEYHGTHEINLLPSIHRKQTFEHAPIQLTDLSKFGVSRRLRFQLQDRHEHANQA